MLADCFSSDLSPNINRTAFISTIKCKIFHFTISFAYHIRINLNRLPSNMVGGSMDIWEIVAHAPIINEGKRKTDFGIEYSRQRCCAVVYFQYQLPR